MSTLAIYKEQAQTCTACQLAEQRTHVVYGEGPENARVLIIGEGPGKSEDEQAKPFVGKAGQDLTKYLAEAGLAREEVYITNVVKCRPPENRDPQPDEIAICTKLWLLTQIELINPELICPLGNHATKFLLAGCNTEKMLEMSSISKVHGKVTEIKMNEKTYKIFPLYHPAAVIYNRALAQEMQKDLEKLKGILQQKTL